MKAGKMARSAAFAKTIDAASASSAAGHSTLRETDPPFLQIAARRAGPQALSGRSNTPVVQSADLARWGRAGN
jgi:hypothetical protein